MIHLQFPNKDVCSIYCNKTEKNWTAVAYTAKQNVTGTHCKSILIELGKIHDAGICTLVILRQPVDAVVAWTGCYTQIAKSWWRERCNTRLTAVTRQSVLTCSRPVTSICWCPKTQAGLQYHSVSQSATPLKLYTWSIKYTTKWHDKPIILHAWRFIIFSSLLTLMVVTWV